MRSSLLAPRLAFFYAAMFTATGVYLPFWPVWLEQARDLTPTDIGLMIAAGYWPRIATVLLIAHLADRLGERRRPMVALCVTALSFAALFALAKEFWPLLALSLITGGAFAGILPLGEALVLSEARAHGLSYGRLRLWGSITFILTAIGAGRLVEDAGAGSVLPLLLGALGLAALACALLPDARIAPAAAGRPLGTVLRQPALLRVVLAAGLIQASHAVYYGFATLHWQRSGLSETTIGLLWAEGVVAEVILFALAGGLLARTGALNLLLIAGALTALRWTLTGLSTAIGVLVLVQLLHAASFGATHLATVHWLRDAVPESQHAGAQSAYAAMMALLLGILTPLAGWLFGAIGGFAFLAMAVLAVLGAALAGFALAPPLERAAMGDDHRS